MSAAAEPSPASLVADTSLARRGEAKLEWATTWMPVLGMVRDLLLAERVVSGRRLAIALPVEPKSACLAAMLAEAGADVWVAGQGATVQDDVAAALAARGVRVFARHGSKCEDERAFFERVLLSRPEVVIDSGATIVRLAHIEYPKALDDLIGVSEETASGLLALRAMEAGGTLRVPCLATGAARCKRLLDERYGAGQSTVATIADTTNLLVGGKRLAVIGYGRLGRGIARRARGLGARVIVCETDPFAALEAHYDGHEVMTVEEACSAADVVMTATGDAGVLPPDAVERLQDGVLLANAGTIHDDLLLPTLRERALEAHVVREHVEEFVLGKGRSVFVIGGAEVVDFAAGEGQPIEITDLTLAIHALAVRHLLLHGSELEAKVHALPHEIDEQVASRKLAALGLSIDRFASEPGRTDSREET